jgi:hypothetical protein
MTPSSPVKVRRCFERAYLLHLLGWRVSRGSNQQERELPASSWLFAWLTLQPLRWGPCAAPKNGLNFTILHIVISHNIESFRFKIIYIDNRKVTERSLVIDIFRDTYFIIRNKQIKKLWPRRFVLPLCSNMCATSSQYTDCLTAWLTWVRCQALAIIKPSQYLHQLDVRGSEQPDILQECLKKI